MRQMMYPDCKTTLNLNCMLVCEEEKPDTVYSPTLVPAVVGASVGPDGG